MVDKLRQATGTICCCPFCSYAKAKRDICNPLQDRIPKLCHDGRQSSISTSETSTNKASGGHSMEVLWYSLLTESALGDACSRVAEGCAGDATDKEVDSMSIAELRSLIHEAAAAAAAAVAV